MVLDALEPGGEEQRVGQVLMARWVDRAGLHPGRLPLCGLHMGRRTSANRLWILDSWSSAPGS